MGRTIAFSGEWVHCSQNRRTMILRKFLDCIFLWLVSMNYVLEKFLWWNFSVKAQKDKMDNDIQNRFSIDRTDFLSIDRTELLLVNRTDFLSMERIFYRYKSKKADHKENFLSQKVCVIFPIWQSLQETCCMYFLPPNQFKK